MSNSASSASPTADYYLLFDGRPEHAVLASQHPFDLEEIPGQKQLFSNRQASISKDMVHSASFFDTRRPARLDHHDILCGPHFSPRYILVSAEWKSAIESLEPGVHDFFDHTLHFNDDDVTGFYILRERVIADDCISPMGQPIEDLREPDPGPRKPRKLNWAPHGHADVAINVTCMRGHHWTLFNSYWPIVSTPLVQKLTPLLPDYVFFHALRSTP